MKPRTSTGSTAPKSLLSLVLGFAGVAALLFLLPRTLTYLLRRIIAGTIREIVAVVLTGLLTEKLASWLGQEPARTNGHTASTAPTPMDRPPL